MESQPGIKKAAKKMLLSRETLQGLRITGESNCVMKQFHKCNLPCWYFPYKLQMHIDGFMKPNVHNGKSRPPPTGIVMICIMWRLYYMYQIDPYSMYVRQHGSFTCEHF